MTMLKYKPKLSGHQSKTLHTLLSLGEIEAARKYLLAFTQATKKDFQTNWHHIAMTVALDLFDKRIIKNLIVLSPPRVGKTETVSRRYPAKAFGNDPKLRIIAASYSSDLAGAANRDVQRIIDDPDYRLIFPDTTLAGASALPGNEAGNWQRNNEAFEVVGHGGIYTAAGIGTGITGKGFDRGLIDDPIKNWKEALSPTVRQTHWDWYTSTFYTRREKGAGICLVMTRWHEEDLAGKIIESAKRTGEPWTVLSFPMLKEGKEVETGYEQFVNPILAGLDPRSVGEPLWPEKYSLEECLNIKRSVGTRVWAGLYQQRPSPAAGALIQRKWIQYYGTLPSEARLRGEWLMSWDLSFKGNDTSDYVVGQVWVKLGSQKYLVDQVRERMGFMQTIQAFKNLVAKYPWVHIKLIEDKANGPAIIDSLKKEVSGIIAVKVPDSKIARVNAVSPDFEAGDVLLPSNALYIHDFVEELVTFPQGANDDQVDAATQALLRFKGKLQDDFSKDLVPKSNKTIAGQRGLGSKKW